MKKTTVVALAKISGHDLLAQSADFPGSTQIRAVNDAALIESYAELIVGGATFPPVLLVDDGSGNYLLADGHHRVEALWIVHALDSERFPPVVEAEVRPGTFADAIRLAIEANRTHGKPMSAGDVTHAFNRAVAVGLLRKPHDWQEAQTLLGCSPRYAQQLTEHRREKYKTERNARIIALSAAGESQRKIADKVGVNQATVARVLDDATAHSAETHHDDETTEAAPAPVNPRRDAERWKTAITAARQALAERLRPDPDDAEPEPVEGVYPLPGAPPLPFTRPAPDDDTPDLIAAALQQIDALPDVAVMPLWLADIDAETAADIETRMARSLDWLTEFNRLWRKQGRAA